MPLFLETYTIPHDLSHDDLVRGLRRVNRGTNVTMLRCAYSLTDGAAWCISEAPSEEALRQAELKIEFAFALEDVRQVDAPDVVDRLPNVDGVFDPREASPPDVPNAAATRR